MAEADRLGIRLEAVAGTIRYDAPAGRMTAGLREAIRQHKAAIVEALNPDAIWERFQARRAELVDALGVDPDPAAVGAAAHAAYLEAIGEPPAKPSAPVRRYVTLPPGEMTALREAVGSWPIPLRERWGRLANQFEDEGDSWRVAEERAFRAVNPDDPDSHPED
jgi:hypothetical protein